MSETRNIVIYFDPSGEHGSSVIIAATRLPHLTAHDVAEIDHEVREVLTEVGGNT